ncbi:hypothetical protein LTR91_002898 [Friedmanniomyces endolithicus]|uniref:Uncharacterized protein n=1 Tax=Friedmanniomyces endolithicus TaxID=329885 RepID=A0AAN6KZK5_9PEZI|nr:hypothetical protein LTR94_009793 [Friedmanniomyces endolithicus]KAK0815887.1 hypothetical protein LTR59_000260 [Friedmanniomyces endolithicus]KAK0835116.1 hypothetical protein LTR03_014219 [Friedmanniomyces endolithicus]KAK0925949.1 hypothetical protein LTR57_004553 [Friedmanniomyces endolithicus]KAK1009248.1 hypothetical protein LTR91_002898 [Friedmanniomyces endolithicus]
MQKQEAEKLAALEKEEADLTYSFNSPSDDRDFHPATTAGPTQIDALRAAITSLNATTIKLGREIDELTKLRNFSSYATWKKRKADAIYCDIQATEYKLAKLTKEFEDLSVEDPTNTDYVDEDEDKQEDEEFEEDEEESDADWL